MVQLSFIKLFRRARRFSVSAAVEKAHSGILCCTEIYYYTDMHVYNVYVNMNISRMASFFSSTKTSIDPIYLVGEVLLTSKLQNEGPNFTLFRHPNTENVFPWRWFNLGAKFICDSELE
jgi:hypothetical protein